MRLLRDKNRKNRLPLETHGIRKTFQRLLTQTPQVEINDGTPSFRKYIPGKIHKRHSRAHKTPTGDLVTTHKSLKGDNRYHTLIADFETLNREKGRIRTLKGENSINDLAGKHKASHGDGNITLNRDNGGHYSFMGEEISIHGPQNRGHISLTPS